MINWNLKVTIIRKNLILLPTMSLDNLLQMLHNWELFGIPLNMRNLAFLLKWFLNLITFIILCLEKIVAAANKTESNIFLTKDLSGFVDLKITEFRP